MEHARDEKEHNSRGELPLFSQNEYAFEEDIFEQNDSIQASGMEWVDGRGSNTVDLYAEDNRGGADTTYEQEYADALYTKHAGMPCMEYILNDMPSELSTDGPAQHMDSPANPENKEGDAADHPFMAGMPGTSSTEGPRRKTVTFDLNRNRFYGVAKSNHIIFDDIVEYSEEERPAGIEIVIETSEDPAAPVLTERMLEFNTVKNFFSGGMKQAEEAPARKIDTVFPRLRDNPFVSKDKERL